VPAATAAAHGNRDRFSQRKGDVSDEIWTTLRILKTTTEYFKKHDIAEARLDAEILLAHVLDCERIHLYPDFEHPLDEGELARYREAVRARAAGRPAKYITGRTEFFSLPFAVDERVLIPRPETELLVERGLELLKKNSGGEFALVLDLCTGSGAVVVALAANFADANYIATDISPGAVELARTNASAGNARERIEFLIGDLFEPIVTMGLDGRFDLILSNPPYVSESEWQALSREIRGFEPRGALVAGPAGDEVERRIVREAHDFLRPGGTLLVELDPSQKKALEDEAVETKGYLAPVFHKDYAQRDRILELEKKP
jgi:release factor glutamine methyltransferase